MNYSIYDFLGNIGVVLIILSYLLLQLGKVNSRSLIYSLMNFFGALMVIVSLMESFNVSAFVIEVFWVGISLIGIIKYLSREKKIKKGNIL